MSQNQINRFFDDKLESIQKYCRTCLGVHHIYKDRPNKIVLTEFLVVVCFEALSQRNSRAQWRKRVTKQRKKVRKKSYTSCEEMTHSKLSNCDSN